MGRHIFLKQTYDRIDTYFLGESANGQSTSLLYDISNAVSVRRRQEHEKRPGLHEEYLSYGGETPDPLCGGGM